MAPTSETPLVSTPSGQANVEIRPANASMQAWNTLSVGAAMIGVSAALIAFNKYLMDDDRFPYALPLVMIHTSFTSVVSVVMFCLFPSLFPSLTDPEKKVGVDRDLIIGSCLPISALFAGQLVLSNAAFSHASIAFCQFLKEGNIVLVYFLSVSVALEKFNWNRLQVLAFIILATTLTIKGEAHFSAAGAVLKGSSLIFESCKLVLQTLLLSNTGRKLDSFTFLLLVMPPCFLLLSGVLGVECIFAHKYMEGPSWNELGEYWPLLLANASLAFVLNLIMAVFCKTVSALGFCLCGVIKDIIIVTVGIVVMNEDVSSLQGFGFSLQLCLILLWSMMKMFPAKFEDGVFNGVKALKDMAIAHVTGEKNKAEEGGRDSTVRGG